MTQKQIDELRSQYTDKFPVGYQYSKARDDVTALLDEIELLKANLENNQKFTMEQFREIDISVKQIKALEAKNVELQTQFDKEKATWNEYNAHLNTQLNKREAENAELRARLDKAVEDYKVIADDGLCSVCKYENECNDKECCVFIWRGFGKKEREAN